MLKRIIKKMGLSNRWKHLLLGIIIGAASNDIYCAILAGGCTAGGMEVKDMLWGGEFDKADFSVMLVGVAVGFLIHIAVWGM